MPAVFVERRCAVGQGFSFLAELIAWALVETPGESALAPPWVEKGEPFREVCGEGFGCRWAALGVTCMARADFKKASRSTQGLAAAPAICAYLMIE
jgi:hypothetical protein